MGRRRRQLTRREALAAGGAGLVAVFGSGCDLLSTDPSGKAGGAEGTPAAPATKEAPALTSQVKAGKLPPLEQRLPSEPLVLEPTERVGVYGGRWHTCTQSVPGDAYEMIGYDGLVRWDPGWTKVIPNIAKSWEIEDGGRAYVFQLRAGTKWSDGTPFTSEDIEFAYTDVLQNKELFPVFPEWLTVDGKPGTFERADDHSFRLSFTEPHALLLERLATPDGSILTALPKAFFRRFHPKYAPDAKERAKKERFAGWTDMFAAKGGLGTLELGAWQTPDLPTLLGWKVSRPMTSDGHFVAVRNPYYWKTDPDGRQLPYLDEVAIDVVTEPNTALLQTTEGRYSLPPSDLLTLQDKPVVAAAREKGKYHFVDWVTSTMNDAILALNLTHRDPALREVFQNRDFRIGLSYAINRPEVIRAVYQRQGTPWQVGPRKESDFYDEKLATQYIEYDVAKADQHLDQAGLTRRDAQEFRLRPDGKRIAFDVEIPTGFKPAWTDAAELLRGYWKNVGVDMRVKSESDSLFQVRVEANQHDAVLYDGNAGLRDALLDPTWYFPYGSGSFFAVAWGTWYNSGGKTGMEPPAYAREQMDLYDRIKVTVDPDQQRELYMRILRIAQEQFYAIGLVLPAVGYNVVQDNLHNVPKSVPEAWLYPDPGPTRPEQFFVEDPQ
ncbi:ABC transporter substrate-binding protein [Actinopolymorpha pittospori]